MLRKTFLSEQNFECITAGRKEWNYSEESNNVQKFKFVLDPAFSLEVLDSYWPKI